MSESFEALLQQADELIKRAHEIRAKEKPAAIERIKAEIAKYELTAEDLGLNASTVSGKEKTTTAAAKGTVGKPRYRNPDTGQTWSGHGKRPHWYTEGLNSGKTEGYFLIKE
ncbi:H-NS family nucleoid-associated regulatory protein [Burkholderia pseudomallei]|uniref:H-NS histone family protein n=1 Tax=Burkholderia pseudomallei TaxID=28450 RepID=UPI00201A6E96|nr:H-NS histone family protein [Burkholderia pseudomallei]MCL4669036.1 H-NS histone family protein [Burkholderia pseudomallei]